MSAKRAIVKTYLAIGTPSAASPTTVNGSMASNIVGPISTIDVVDQVCYQVTWTSTNAVGVFSIQGSVDGVNFTDLTFNPPLAQPASNNGTYLVNLALIPFPYIRPNYIATSGTGSMTVYYSAKGV